MNEDHKGDAYEESVFIKKSDLKDILSNFYNLVSANIFLINSLENAKIRIENLENGVGREKSPFIDKAIDEAIRNTDEANERNYQIAKRFGLVDEEK